MCMMFIIIAIIALLRSYCVWYLLPKWEKTNASHISVPQRALGHCVKNAPVAFLKDFKVKCVTLLQSCPIGSPLQTSLTDLRIQVKNGQGGMSYLLNKR